MDMIAHEPRGRTRVILRSKGHAHDCRPPTPLPAEIQLWLGGIPFPRPRPLTALIEEAQRHHHHDARPRESAAPMQIPYSFAVGPFPDWGNPRAPRFPDWLPTGTDAVRPPPARRTPARHLPVYQARVPLTPAQRRELDRLGAGLPPQARARTDVRPLLRADVGTSVGPPGRPSVDIDANNDRPQTRGDCVGGARPCPWVSCRHHLFLDVNPSSGSLKLNHPGTDVSEMVESCSLDVADRGELSLPEIARTMNVTFERVRQIQMMAQRSVTKGLQRGRWRK